MSNDENGSVCCLYIGYLFRSVAATGGRNAASVLLTADGAKEMKLMKEKRAVTIAQDEESSVIHGYSVTSGPLADSKHLDFYIWHRCK